MLFNEAVQYIEDMRIPKLYKFCTRIEEPFFRSMGYYQDNGRSVEVSELPVGVV